MRFSLTTWNINSVRLRIDLVAKFLEEMQPDVLCLQETKCPDDAFPLKRFKQLGYDHVVLNGQKGYHGVAIVSKLPFESSDIRVFCNNLDSRHISVSFGEKAGMAVPLIVHDFYVPAGGDVPDPDVNAKFAHKLSFLDEMKTCEPLHPRGDARHILVGDLNVAPHENDVWSHKQMLKIVSHTPIECEKLLAVQSAGRTGSTSRANAFHCRKRSTRGGATAPPTGRSSNRGRRLDHIWVSSRTEGFDPRLHRPEQMRGAGSGHRTTYRSRRCWSFDDRVTELSLAPISVTSLASWLTRVAMSSRRRRAAAGSLSSTR